MNINAISYSPDGAAMAVGSEDNFIDIYSTRKGCARSGLFRTRLIGGRYHLDDCRRRTR
jgi:WD40 repeat protein